MNVGQTGDGAHVLAVAPCLHVSGIRSLPLTTAVAVGRPLLSFLALSCVCSSASPLHKTSFASLMFPPLYVVIHAETFGPRRYLS